MRRKTMKRAMHAMRKAWSHNEELPSRLPVEMEQKPRKHAMPNRATMSEPE
jgi:hypothetical protein